jgi:2-dehydro-3-deoxyphosphogalactonate aldolase
MPIDAFLPGHRIVAILRGVDPDKVVEIGETLHEAGIRAIEVPLNSPRPFVSIERLSAALGAHCLCGAGTVLSVENVARARDAGARLIVSPNTDRAVIAKAVSLGMEVLPGFATATEAFAALSAVAARLKLFPASTYGVGHLKALKAVLPKDAGIYAVGGIGAEDVAAWRVAGASGFGFGSELFKPDYAVAEIARRAARLVKAMKDAAS